MIFGCSFFLFPFFRLSFLSVVVQTLTDVGSFEFLRVCAHLRPPPRCCPPSRATDRLARRRFVHRCGCSAVCSSAAHPHVCDLHLMRRHTLASDTTTAIHTDHPDRCCRHDAAAAASVASLDAAGAAPRGAALSNESKTSARVCNGR